ncbi:MULTISPECIES: ABC transporter permease [unclassified Vibrio]|uniref:ABC transporter permease n=1 Tax=Vibrio sp. HB236076 TaxID=3232307 RepID=A0AB39HF28_9VIBR|nr:hypothetical protein [Vibrio sp. HB161653]MDP5254063.1 hypothetical protein [Vibrio sp. HB161653]
MMNFQQFTWLMRMGLFAALLIPVLMGVVGVLMPALGYFPALGEMEIGFGVFATLFQVDGLATMVGLSLFTGVISTLIATLGALALISVFYHHAWLAKIQRLLSPLLVIPHAAAAIALILLLSPSGWLARIVVWGSEAMPPQWDFPYDRGGLAIIFALALKELPFIFLILLSTLEQPQLKRRFDGYLKTAQSLGYSPVMSLVKTVLPVVYPHIRLPLLAVLAYATANVEIPLILGPNDPPTLAVAILHWFNHVDLSLRFQASAAALLQLAVTLFALVFWLILERAVRLLTQESLVRGRSFGVEHLFKFVAYFFVVLYFVMALLMMLSLVLWSLATYWSFPDLLPQGVTLLHWQTALTALSTPIVNSLGLGIVVSLSAVCLVLFALEAEVGQVMHKKGRWRQWEHWLLNVTLYLPLIIPGVAFLFGLVWFQQVYWPKLLWFNVYISHFVYVLPYVFISLAVSYRRFEPRYLKVAAGLGIGPLQTFLHVKLPLLFRPILVAFALGLSISFSQYLPTLLASGGRMATVTTEAVAIVSGSSTRLSAVYVLVQLILPLLGFVLAWWLPKVCFNPKTETTHK